MTYLSPDAFAAELGCSHDSVLRAIKRGDLRAFKYGRLVRISRADADAFLTAHTTTSARRLRSSA